MHVRGTRAVSARALHLQLYINLCGRARAHTCSYYHQHLITPVPRGAPLLNLSLRVLFTLDYRREAVQLQLVDCQRLGLPLEVPQDQFARALEVLRIELDELAEAAPGELRLPKHRMEEVARAVVREHRYAGRLCRPLQRARQAAPREREDDGHRTFARN